LNDQSRHVTLPPPDGSVRLLLARTFSPVGQHVSTGVLDGTASLSNSVALVVNGVSVRRSLNDGTTRISASTTTPSAPKPTEAAAKISGCSVALTMSTDALESTSVRETRAVESEPSLRPVPCVLV
jgi:hypothetical protein